MNKVNEARPASETSEQQRIVKTDEFFIGQELSWLHGLHSHRIGTVTIVAEDTIAVRGVTKEYSISKTAMLRKLLRAERDYFLGSRVGF